MPRERALARRRETLADHEQRFARNAGLRGERKTVEDDGAEEDGAPSRPDSSLLPGGDEQEQQAEKQLDRPSLGARQVNPDTLVVERDGEERISTRGQCEWSARSDGRRDSEHGPADEEDRQAERGGHFGAHVSP